MPRFASTRRRRVLGAMVALACDLALLPAPAWAASIDPAHDVERVVQLTNMERGSAGLSPLTLNTELSAAAQNYSQVLASGTCFGHVCGSVPDFAERLGRAGYTGWLSIAENIAAGYPTPEAVVAGWMASSGHRANILSTEYAETGIGMVTGGQYGTYWTQEFGARAQARLSLPASAADDTTGPDVSEEQP